MSIDKCMELLFQETEIVKMVLKWLQPSSAQVFMANAALMVANLSRSGTVSIVVVMHIVKLLNCKFPNSDQPLLPRYLLITTRDVFVQLHQCPLNGDQKAIPTL